MRIRMFVLALFACAMSSMTAAQQIYNDGPINGNEYAWEINNGYTASDSFTVSGGTSTVTGLSFGVWLFFGDVLQSGEIIISDQPIGGTVFFDQVVNLTESGCSVNQYDFNVCTATAIFDGPTLNNGRYWLTLGSVFGSEEPVYWDENFGDGCTSPGCPSDALSNGAGTIPAESFTILGGPARGTTPEPSSLMLLATGVIGACGFVRRKLL